jgi:hypothetical protein
MKTRLRSNHAHKQASGGGAPGQPATSRIVTTRAGAAGAPGQPAASRIATTRAGAALAPTRRSGKHATVKPVPGS